MSEIVKTEAVVLNKIDYRDTSVIASLYTEEVLLLRFTRKILVKYLQSLKVEEAPNLKQEGLLIP
jgi:hypothetical protein